ncbi:MAG: hypothetical protein WBA61_04200 [Aequorivita sp.]
MKNFILLVFTCTLISCGHNQEEKMLYNYQQKNVKSLNFDLDDLDFNIQKIQKVTDIKAADSAKYYKRQFAEYWTKNPDSMLIDTLRFDFVQNLLNDRIMQEDTLVKLYQESVLTAIRIGDISYEYESKRKRDKAIDEKHSLKETLSDIQEIEHKHNTFANKPDSILSIKYRANYTLKNPLMSDIKQTFDKYFYTDASLSKFVKEESVEDTK